jgi:uncharacterized protein
MKLAVRGAVLAVALVCTQCDRAPSEPVATANAKPKQRCMRPTSEAAPPPAKGPDPRCPRDPDGGPPKVPEGHVTFREAKDKPAVTVEVMKEEPHRNRGLMYRTDMAEDRGMIFVFEDSEPRTFWMHNTCLPLDMLFIAADGFVTGILENVPTMNDDPRTIPCPAKYVLEVNAGYARRHGIKAGQSLAIDGLTP